MNYPEFPDSCLLVLKCFTLRIDCLRTYISLFGPPFIFNSVVALLNILGFTMIVFQR